MKITIDIPESLYRKIKIVIDSKKIKDAFSDPLVMLGLHVVESVPEEELELSHPYTVNCHCSSCSNHESLLPKIIDKSE